MKLIHFLCFFLVLNENFMFSKLFTPRGFWTAKKGSAVWFFETRASHKWGLFRFLFEQKKQLVNWSKIGSLMDNQPATIYSKRQGPGSWICPLMEKNGATIASINNDMEATQKQNTQPKTEHFFRGSQIYTHCWRSHATWQCKSASIWEIWRSAEWLQSWNWETQWNVVLLFVLSQIYDLFATKVHLYVARYVLAIKCEF